MYSYEKELWAKGFKLVAGVDEVGRGAWAGPLVAAAVILPRRLNKLRDSKVLKAKERETIYRRLMQDAICACGVVEVEEINKNGLTWANHHAMVRAVNALSQTPHHLLVDYVKLPKRLIAIPQTAITDGDAISASIAAASIVAKVTRDQIMAELHHKKSEALAEFHFHRNFGYGTKAHQSALAKCGATKHHRRFYAPVAQSLQLRIDLRSIRDSNNIKS